MDRPQAVDRPRTAVRDSPLTPHVLVELAISINRKMAEQFPKDAHADITIQIKDKRYELQKALLRIEAPYFDQDKILFPVTDLDPDVFEGILRCLYGGSYQISSFNDLYLAYQAAEFIRCDSLKKQIEQAFTVNRKNFTLAFQLSELYGLEDLRTQCYDFLETEPDAFLYLLDVGMLRIRKNHKKATPSDVLGLNLECFKHLVMAHNNYKTKKVSPLELFQVIEMYAKNEDQLMELVVVLLDRERLSSREYELIYHNLAVKHKSEVSDEPKIQLCHESVKIYKMRSFAPNYREYFEPEKSESYLTKLRMKELQQENARLFQETQKLQIALETTMKNTINLKDSLLETIQAQLDTKIIDKEREIVELRKTIENLNSLLLKREERIRELENQTLLENYSESEGTFVLQESVQSRVQMVESELYITKSAMKFPTNSLSITQNKRSEWDAESSILDNSDQLNFLFEHLGTTIFQQVFLRRLYLGSRNGFDSGSLWTQIENEKNLLMIMKVFDYGNLVGLFIKGEVVRGEQEASALLLTIASQKIGELKQIQVCSGGVLFRVNGLRIVDDCDTVECTGEAKLCGSSHFTVEDMEVYSLEISNGI